MSTVKLTRMTAEEFFDFVHRTENRDRNFELQQGEVVEMPLPGERHGLVCSNVALVLGLYVRHRLQGYALCKVGVVLERAPDTVQGPDAAFFQRSRPYRDMSPKFAEEVPTLAVEVWSPGERPGRMAARVSQYLRSGVRMVWVIDTEGRHVTVHQAGKEDEVYDSTQELAGADVLPDFRCAVADFFYTAADREL